MVNSVGRSRAEEMMERAPAGVRRRSNVVASLPSAVTGCGFSLRTNDSSVFRPVGAALMAAGKRYAALEINKNPRAWFCRNKSIICALPAVANATGACAL